MHTVVELPALAFELVEQLPGKDDRAHVVSVALVGPIMLAIGQPPQAGKEAASLKTTHPEPPAHVRHDRGVRGQHIQRKLSDEVKHDACERAGGASGERSPRHGVPRHCT